MRIAFFAALTVALASYCPAASHTEVTQAPRIPFMRGMNFRGFYENTNDSSPQNQQTFVDLRNKGFDHVRLPVDFRSYSSYNSSTKTATLNSSISRVDTAVNYAEATGLYIIVDFHGWFDIDPTDASSTNQFVAIWKAVAERYKNRSNKVIFELANEPNNSNFGALCTMQRNAIKEIRTTNLSRLILFDPGDASQPWVLTQAANPPKFTWVTLPSNDNNVAVVVHSYNPGEFTHQGAWGHPNTKVPLTDAHRSTLNWDLRQCKAYMDGTGVPLVMDEFGAAHSVADHGDVTEYLSMVTRWCEANKVPWAPWLYYWNGSEFDCRNGQNGAWIDYVMNGLFPDFDHASSSFPTSSYTKAVNVTFSGYTGGEALANFPALVRLSTSITGFRYSDFALPNGGDLRFTDSAGNLIPHEIDTWNSNGVSTVWVKVPSLTSTAKVVAHYGCAKPVVPKVESVWDSNYVGVWHLGESKLPLKESSETSRDVTSADGTGIGYGANGVAGGAIDFGSADGARCVNADDHAELGGFQKITVEAWTWQGAHSKNPAGILSKRVGYANNMTFYMFDSGSATSFYVSTNGTASSACGISLNPVMNQWNHQAYSLDATASSSNARGYLNGASAGTASVSCPGGLFDSASELHFGNLGSSNATNFPGKIDEVRISKTVRSDDWLKATHDTVMSPSFASYAVAGEPEPPVEYGPLDMDAYSKKVDVTFSGYSGTELTNFPVLVRLSPNIPGFSYSDFTKPNGGDLRFADSDGNLIPHEIDTWNSNGVSTVWVKVPRLTLSAMVTASYGCTGEPAAVDAKDVWDEDYVGVWHLGESALPLKESSQTSSDFTSQSGTGIGYAAAGAVGGSVDFGAPGNSRMLDADDHDALDGFETCTFEAWTFITNRPTGGDVNTGLLSKRASYSSNVSYYIYDTSAASAFYVSSNGAAATFCGSLTPTAGAWTHQVMTFDAGSMKGYKDGLPKSTASCAVRKINAGSSNLHLGNFNAGDARNFPGRIDELRISKVARSADWVQATHDTVMNPSFASYAMDGGYDAWMSSHALLGAPEAVSTNGIPNGIRYAFDLDPMLGPTEIGEPILRVVMDANGNPCVRFREVANPQGVTLGVLATERLDTWDETFLINMELFADGLWKPSASRNQGYTFPPQMFFKYLIGVSYGD